MANEDEEGVRPSARAAAGFYNRENPYVDPATGKDWPANAERFVFFNKAVLESLHLMRWVPDVLHLNDYQAGLIPILLREAYAGDPEFLGAWGRSTRSTTWGTRGSTTPT